MNPQLFKQIEQLPRPQSSPLEIVEENIKKSNESGFGRPTVQAKILIAAIFGHTLRNTIFGAEDSEKIIHLLEVAGEKYQRLKQTSPIQQNLKAVFDEVVNQNEPAF